MREQPDLLKDFTVKEYAARDVTRDEFQDIKVHCGKKTSLPIAKFRVPGLPEHSSVRVQFPK
jgi:hypothetical protein